MMWSMILAAALAGRTSNLPEFVQFERSLSPIFVMEKVTLTSDGTANGKPHYKIHYERTEHSGTTSNWLDGDQCPSVVGMIPPLMAVQPDRPGSGPHISDGRTYSLETAARSAKGHPITSSNPGSQLAKRVEAAFDALENCLPDNGPGPK